MGGAVSAPERAYTVVLTSCGRFDLLRATVASLLARLDAPPARFLVIEDSAGADAEARLAQALDGLAAPACGFDLWVNRPQLGQMGSIDRAYTSVATPYVFHCEDDWEFTRGGFIAESFAILEARPEASMVGLRPRAELNPLVRATPGERLGVDGPEFFALDPKLHPEYFSYSFNPGLRRMADARPLMPFAALGREEDVSYAFKTRGFRIANLEHAAVRHIGDGRHVEDPTSRPKPKTLLQRLRRSAAKRLKRLRRGVGGG